MRTHNGIPMKVTPDTDALGFPEMSGLIPDTAKGYREFMEKRGLESRHTMKPYGKKAEGRE